MEFTNRFDVPVPPAEAWRALMDIERVAECMPGATLLKVDGDIFEGKVKVKVGPIAITYLGKAEFVEKDEPEGRIVLLGRGKEERGSGTASMRVTATLTPAEGDTTTVTVLTDLDISGRPAQFGRGVIEQVGSGIIRQFSERLTAQITAADRPAASPASGPASDAASAPRPLAEEPDSSALDLASLVPPELKGKATVALAALAGLAVGVLAARRGGRGGSWPGGQPAVLVVHLRPGE